MDGGGEHYTRNVLFDRKAGEDAAKPLNLQLLRISRLEVKEDHHYFPHDHLWGELIIPLRKTYACVINGCSLLVEPGQMLLVQPFDRHEDFYHQGGELIFFIFELHDLSGQLWRDGIVSAQAPVAARALNLGVGSPLERLLDFLLAQTTEGENQMLAQVKLGEAFLWRMIAAIPTPWLSPRLVDGIERSAFRRRVLAYFMEDARAPLDAACLAATLGMSKRSMEYKFRALFGTSPGRAFTAYKIQLAAQMLRRGDSVKAVAERFGFSDQFYFSTVFKRLMGFPPSQVGKNS